MVFNYYHLIPQQNFLLLYKQHKAYKHKHEKTGRPKTLISFLKASISHGGKTD